MHIDDLRGNFVKRAAKLKYELGEPASMEKIEETESKLGVSFTLQVKWFYKNMNGFQTDNPLLEVLPLNSLSIDDRGRILFSIIDGKHKLCFDTTGINDAGQWDIINSETEYRVTFTLASFWSNKIWAWLDKARPIWKEENHC